MKHRKILTWAVSALLSVCILCSQQSVLAYWCVDNVENVPESYELDIANPEFRGRIDDVIYGRVQLFDSSDWNCQLGAVMDYREYSADGNPVYALCNAYAKATYYYCFGEIPELVKKVDFKYSDRVLEPSLTVNYEQFRDAGIMRGAYIISIPAPPHSLNDDCEDPCTGHAMIIIDYDEEGITILNGNADFEGHVLLQNYTWDEFNYYQFTGSTEKPRMFGGAVQPKREVLDDMTAPKLTDYEIVTVSPSGYSFDFTATDNIGLKHIYVDSWAEDGSYGSAIRTEMKVRDDNRYHVFDILSDHDKEIKFHFKVTLVDIIGNETVIDLPDIISPVSIFEGTPEYAEPVNYGIYNNHLYLAYNESQNWLTDKKFAEKMGGYFVSISSEEENSFVAALLNEAGIEASYVGLSYKGNNGFWNWSDGTNISYTNYGTNDRFNALDNDYLAMSITPDDYGTWYYVDGFPVIDGEQLGFVVEIDLSQYSFNEGTDYDFATYYTCDDSISYVVAQILAEEKGGYLVTPQSGDEADFIVSVGNFDKVDGYYLEDSSVITSDGSVVDALGLWAIDDSSKGFIFKVPGEGPISLFVERLYTCALKRASESEGKQTWIDSLESGTSGADIARGVFFSQEFISQNVNDVEYVTRLYRTFMDREPDQAGLATWVKVLINGGSREDVFNGFVNSEEWSELCDKYGIVSGKVEPKLPSEEIMDFVSRLYTVCLGREADYAGLISWAQDLEDGTRSGTEVAYGVIFSPEFINNKYTDMEFVIMMYHTFMNREPDLMGFHTWMRALEHGSTREDVFLGFTGSDEWKGICKDYGIKP